MQLLLTISPVLFFFLALFVFFYRKHLVAFMYLESGKLINLYTLTLALLGILGFILMGLDNKVIIYIWLAISIVISILIIASFFLIRSKSDENDEN